MLASGPWYTSDLDLDEIFVFSSEGRPICELSYDGDVHSARLIAAAPELLDALRELVEIVEFARENGYDDIDYFTTQPGRQAIACATRVDSLEEKAMEYDNHDSAA